MAKSKAKYRIVQDIIITRNTATGEETRKEGKYITQKKNGFWRQCVLGCLWEDLWLGNNFGEFDRLDDAIEAMEKHLNEQKIKTSHQYEVVWEMPV